jgi:paraquat-inducible protein B
MLKRILIIGGLFLLLMGCRSQPLQINVNYSRLSGLAPGDRVVFQGNTAGYVDAIHYNKNSSYVVQLNIDKGFVNAATEHTRFKVADDRSLPGHKAIVMTLPREGGLPLTDGAFVRGEEAGENMSEQLKQSVDEGFSIVIKQLEGLVEDLKRVPQSEAYRQLKESLSELGDEIERSEGRARQKIKEEWLPFFEKELNELQRRLKVEGREEETKSLQDELDRIRKI